MTRERRELGEGGEEAALRRLKEMGYREVARNYRSPLGEIDVVAWDGDTLVFVEIKTRRDRPLAYAKEAVHAGKQRKLSMLALAYLKEHDLQGVKARFDVVAVSVMGRTLQMEVVRNAFDLAY